MIYNYILTVLITIEIFIVSIIAYRKVSTEKPKINFKILAFLIMSTLTITFLTFKEQYYFKVIVILLSTTIINSLLYKDDIFKAFFYSFFIWFSLFIVDTGFSIIVLLNKLNYYDISFHYLFRFLITIPISLIEYLLFIVLLKKINSIYNNYYLKHSNNIVFVFALTFSIAFISFLAVLNAIKSNKTFFSYFTILVLIIFLFLVFYIIKFIIKSYNLSSLNKNIINENKLIKEMSKKDAIFKHNLINNLLGVEVVANEKAKLLIDELIIKYKNDYEKISNINELPSGIQGLIYKKIYLKNISNLNFRVENGFEGDIEKLMTSKNYNLLSETIGILLDNALEAVENCPNKIIVIDMEKTDDNIYFEIKNSFDSQIDFEELGSAKYTTKKSGHGIGINYLLENKSVELKSSIVNNLFQVEAIIKIKK